MSRYLLFSNRRHPKHGEAAESMLPREHEAETNPERGGPKYKIRTVIGRTRISVAVTKIPSETEGAQRLSPVTQVTARLTQEDRTKIRDLPSEHRIQFGDAVHHMAMSCFAEDGRFRVDELTARVTKFVEAVLVTT